MSAGKTVRITLELDADHAAGLKRFAEKVSHSDAMAVLYSHVAREVRSEQASEIIAAFARLESELAKASVTSWPWIETGRT